MPDHLIRLYALRDRLEELLPTAAHTQAANLAAQLRPVLADIAELEREIATSERKGTVLDELQERRRVSGSSNKGSAAK